MPFIRPEEFATATATDKDFLVHAMNWFEENEGSTPEYWVHLRPTTPLRELSVINNAIDVIMQDKIATSLRSGHKAPESPLKWFVKDNYYFKGLLSDEDYNLPKEEFEQVYIPDGYVDVVKSSFVMNNQAIHGDKMIGFESPVCTEVDSEEEFEYIQYQLDKNGSKFLDYLNQVKS